MLLSGHQVAKGMHGSRVGGKGVLRRIQHLVAGCGGVTGCGMTRGECQEGFQRIWSDSCLASGSVLGFAPTVMKVYRVAAIVNPDMSMVFGPWFVERSVIGCVSRSSAGSAEH